MNSDGTTKCLVCQKQYKKILMHLAKSEKCKSKYTATQLKKLQHQISEDPGKCSVCNKEVKQILKHLAKSVTCKTQYPINELAQLKEKSKKNNDSKMQKYHTEHSEKRKVQRKSYNEKTKSVSVNEKGSTSHAAKKKQKQETSYF